MQAFESWADAYAEREVEKKTFSGPLLQTLDKAGEQMAPTLSGPDKTFSDSSVASRFEQVAFWEAKMAQLEAFHSDSPGETEVHRNQPD